MAFRPAFGYMFTEFSIKKVYMAAILMFEIGSIVCATARDSITLIVGRLIAGAGGGGLYVGTFTLMGFGTDKETTVLYLASHKHVWRRVRCRTFTWRSLY